MRMEDVEYAIILGNTGLETDAGASESRKDILMDMTTRGGSGTIKKGTENSTSSKITSRQSISAPTRHLSGIFQRGQCILFPMEIGNKNKNRHSRR